MTVAIVALGLGTLLLKSLGPLTNAGRPLPPIVERSTRLLPIALLAALVATQTLVGLDGPTDPRPVGVAAAAIATARGAPFPVVVLIGAGTTALLRAALAAFAA